MIYMCFYYSKHEKLDERLESYDFSVLSIINYFNILFSVQGRLGTK